MAHVWLADYECDRDWDLPPVCMKCGADAGTAVRQTFRWCPPWVHVLHVAGLVVWVVALVLLTRRRTVRVPLCDRHAGHFLVGKLNLYWLLLVGTSGGIAALVYGLSAAEKPPPADWSPVLFAAIILVSAGALVGAAIVSQRLIRTREINEDEIRLICVSEEFVAALREQRRAERDARELRRAERETQGQQVRDREPAAGRRRRGAAN